MIPAREIIEIRKLKVKPGKAISLKEYATEYKGKSLNKQMAADLLDEGREHLALVQDKLYAQNRYSVLIILQAMDAAGKDSVVKHIMSGFNPLGVKVYSFKSPTHQELDHTYLWRHYLALPARGEIAIHNRSHYENVLVTRVHPEYILSEHLPEIDSIEKIDDAFWERRFKQINHFEKTLTQNGTIVLKFFLHVSKKEQKKRFMERIDDPSKNWKFSYGDLNERARWEDYQSAYEKAISATAKENAPWFIIPADDKWYARLAIASVIYQQFDAMHIAYPDINLAQKEELAKARIMLMQEDDASEKKKKKRTRAETTF
jgi:PPK2 family polyphosphate:nucleotide phosphotransferase